MNIVSYVMVGNSNVGKTTLQNSYVDKNKSRQITIGTDFNDKIVEVESHQIKLQIYDTAGAERFHAIGRSFYNKGDIFLLVYDITDRVSFEKLGFWLSEIKKNAAEQARIILVGNKLDKYLNRQVSKADGEKFAKENHLSFFQTSATDNINVKELFETYLLDTVEIVRKISHPIGITLSKTNTERNCCK